MSGEVDDGDAGTAETDVFVVVGGYATDCGEVVADALAEGTCACTVEYADALGAELDGIVDKIGDCLQCFISPHATHVYLLLEVKLPAAEVVGGGGTDEGCFARS